MSQPLTLSSQARLVLLLNALYNVADALCSVFVGVYFYVHSMRFEVVCYHYLALYAVTPAVYLFSGWCAQRFDRLHVFRVGVGFHALYYGALLWMQEGATDHPVALGALLGVAWGFFWAGNNTFNYDAVEAPQRDYFFGWLNAVTGASRFGAPAVSALIMWRIPEEEKGYYVLFAMAVGLYLLSILASTGITRDSRGRPFNLKRALFPGRDQRDWRLVMAASATQAGSFHIFYFVLGLAMYMKTENAALVGVYTALQFMAGIIVSYMVGRTVRPASRLRSMRISVALLMGAALMIASLLNAWTLVLFGILRSIALPMFMIPYSSIRLDIIDRSASEPAERIEYMCASEVPLAGGRVVMMVLLLALVGGLGELGMRIGLFLLCANSFFSYLLIRRTSVVQSQLQVI